jgi:hypothetical protein
MDNETLIFFGRTPFEYVETWTRRINRKKDRKRGRSFMLRCCISPPISDRSNC